MQISVSISESKKSYKCAKLKLTNPVIKSISKRGHKFSGRKLKYHRKIRKNISTCFGSSWILTNLITTDLFSTPAAGTSPPTGTQHTVCQSDLRWEIACHQRCYSTGQRLGGGRGATHYIDTEQTPGPGTASATMRSLILTIHTRQKNSVIWLYVVLETNIVHLKKCQHVAPSCLGYVYLKILFLQAFYLTIMIMSSKSQP